MNDLLVKINAEIDTFKAEAEALTEKGVKAAGPRARKSTLEIEKLLKEFRKVSIEESKK
ncbi:MULTISPECIES: histone H1 [Flavobacterium]|uniref:Histone H1 n=1 Tax=Flavobacterium cupriresistens TaxID=2893885 RepID=A0ABU4RGR8_9FLAO|nr:MULTISPECIES: histone H1 [unclassified Flavobacterium]KLT69302.1 histone H1 [Flavobacterium sp. ABG]MDX6191768.1 histone H1 [Flavobacterium sp. Fl-318]UFH41711.1 histone H1 [Flavobacterium sp. F-323]